MATTAKGTPYVESSDLVANYPAVSLALAEHIDDFGGKILQVVRATDGTERTTTSTTDVDVTGMSVTITPQRSNSAVLIVATCNALIINGTSNDMLGYLSITDSSNNVIAGAQSGFFGTQFLSRSAEAAVAHNEILVGYSTPASTSAQTYKLRFKVNDAASSLRIRNQVRTGQMFAIEVSG